MPCPCRLLVTGCQSTDFWLIQAIVASVVRHLERHDLPLLARELHPDQMNRLAAGAVIGGVVAGLQLGQGTTLGDLLHDLELATG